MTLESQWPEKSKTNSKNRLSKAWGNSETPVSEDERIQIIGERNDEVYVFCVQGFLPAPTALTVINSPANNFIRLRWLPSPGSVQCTVRGGVVGSNETISRDVAIEDFTTFARLRVPKSILTPGAVYEFEVSCSCSLEPEVSSDFASSGGFVPVPMGQMMMGEGSDLDASMELFPNPAKGQVQLAFSLSADHNGTLEVHDLSGRRVVQQNLPSQESGLVILSLDGIAPGMYTVTMRNNDTRLVQKLIVH